MDLHSISLELTRSLQQSLPWLDGVARLFTLLGREEFYFAFMPLIYWCVSKPLGIDLVILLVFSNGLNGWLKSLFKQPRPFWLDPAVALDTELTFGLPSGHAMNAVAMWGHLAVVLRRHWQWLCLAVILLTALARLFLGVHFLGDIVAGWALGLAVLWIYYRARPAALDRLRGLNWPAHVALASGGAFGVIALFALADASGNAGQQSALALAARAEAWDTAGTTAGLLLGAWLGLVGQARQVRFRVTGPFAQRLARYLIGMVGVLVLWMGLKLVFPTEPLAVGLAFRVLRYALAILWVAWWWPALCVRFGLASSELAR